MGKAMRAEVVSALFPVCPWPAQCPPCGALGGICLLALCGWELFRTLLLNYVGLMIMVMIL